MKDLSFFFLEHSTLAAASSSDISTLTPTGHLTPRVRHVKGLLYYDHKARHSPQHAANSYTLTSPLPGHPQEVDSTTDGLVYSGLYRWDYGTLIGAHYSI